jgi:hypothetical protein
MITFNNIGYMGRLGNQMFQFATTLSIAELKKSEARFPLDNCNIAHPTGPFDSSIGSNTNVKCDLLDCFKIDPKYFIPGNSIVTSYMYQEQDFNYNQNILNIPENCTLNGYFQSEKYFIEIRDMILEQFRFRSEYSEIAKVYMDDIRKKIGNSGVTSIHVRRGDYLTSPDHHPTCSIEYYQESIQEMKRLGSMKFVIFSDDPSWCRTAFVGDDYIISELGNSYSELCAMTLCDNHIIANSSFSWWGAWLNTNVNKKVIAPSRWFGPALVKNTSDIYCKEWKII